MNVTYVHPEKFYDLPFATWERDEMLGQITDYFKELGKALPASVVRGWTLLVTAATTIVFFVRAYG